MLGFHREKTNKKDRKVQKYKSTVLEECVEDVYYSDEEGLMRAIEASIKLEEYIEQIKKLNENSAIIEVAKRQIEETREKKRFLTNELNVWANARVPQQYEQKRQNMVLYINQRLDELQEILKDLGQKLEFHLERHVLIMDGVFV